MKKILVLGSAGMAGHTIYNYLYSLNKYIVLGLGKELIENQDALILDIKTSLDKLQSNILKYRPHIIINCIGILVKASENDPENAIFVNSYFPNWLAKITKNTQTKIIHLSTDCVFSGKTGYYLDTDEPDGTGVYSRSKALGEIVNNKDLTVRMSIIGSELKKGGSGLFSWFLRSKGTVKGYSGALWNGLTTLELAKAIDALIGSDIVGLYQLAPTYSISKYALLKLIKEIWKKKNVKIIPDLGLIQNKTLVNSKQQIPNYVMPDSYRTMLQEYKDYLDANESK